MKKLGIADDTLLAGEILGRVMQFNYVPTKKTGVYAAGLLVEYKRFLNKTE